MMSLLHHSPQVVMDTGSVCGAVTSTEAAGGQSDSTRAPESAVAVPDTHCGQVFYQHPDLQE